MLKYYIFTSFLLYQGFAVPLSSPDCNGQECDDFPDCSNSPCPCLHPSKMYCNIYYICTDDLIKKFSCSSGLLFDEDNLTCDYENKVDCKNRTLVPPSVSSTQQVSTVKDLDIQTTIKYSHLSEVETTPITINDIVSSLQTDKQETTDSSSTITIPDYDETNTSTSKSITNVTEISFSTMDLKTLSSTIQANATDQRPIDEEATSEATSHTQDEDASEKTSKHQEEDISEATSQSQNEETSENTLVAISTDGLSTEHSKSTVKFITKEPISEKPTTINKLSTETTQNNITQSTTITLDTSSDSFTKRNSTSSIPDYISTKGQPSVETEDGNDLNYNFSCPSRFGLFADLENCYFFYQCSHFIPYHIQCPSDLHFNSVLQVCDWPYEAGCENATSKDFETSTSITSTKIASSTAQPTKISYPSSSIAYTTANYTTSHETESTSDHVSSTVKNIFSTEKESTSTKGVKEITENSTDIKTLISNFPTTMIDITTSTPDNLTSTGVSLDTISPNKNITVQPQTDNDETSMIDITTTSKPDNLTSIGVSLDTISPNENITVQPLTGNDETSVNMTNSTEKTNQFESTVTDSITKADTVADETSSSKLMTTEIDLSNNTDTTLKPQTKNDYSEITINFETTTTDLTTTNETNFSTEKTIGENDLNNTTLNPESKIASVEIMSETEPVEVSSSSVQTSSDPIETDDTSEVETMESKMTTTFVNETENDKIITDAPEIKTSSRKSDFEYTVTVTHLQSSTHKNNFTTSDFEIVSTTYNITTPDHDQKTISTRKENKTSTATQEFVTFTTKAVGSTSSVPVVNISTQSTNEILESTTNVFLTDESMQTSQPDKMDSTTETLPEETTEEIVQNFTCISRFGLFPDPESCNYFYQCSHFIPYHLQCPSDLHFNPILEVCDWPYEAGCELNSTDKVYTPHPQTNTASNISSTYEYQTDKTREDIISTETASTETASTETASTETASTESESTETESTETESTEKTSPSESDKLLTSLKPTYKPSSTATPDVTIFKEMTSKISNYSTSIFINSTPEVDNETISTDEQAFTTKNNSHYSTIGFTNSTKETEFEITSYTEPEIVTKNGSDYSTIKFTKETETTTVDNGVITTKNNSDYSTIYYTNSTKETEIDTSPTEQEFVTKNGSDHHTINFTNSTKEAVTETTNPESQEYTTKNNSDYNTTISANSTKTEIVTFSELQELTSKIQTEKVTMKYISTNADKLETTLDYKTTREKNNDTTETSAATSLNKQSTIGETEQPLDFECPSRFGLYPDIQNCSRFYQCSQWSATLMNCPTELHFNPILEVCDWPIDAGCEITLQETSTTDAINEIEEDFECPLRFGLFPDKSNCSRFYQCSQWTSYPKQCSPGLHFNADLKVCASPYEAGCDKSLITNEETNSTEEK